MVQPLFDCSKVRLRVTATWEVLSLLMVLSVAGTAEVSLTALVTLKAITLGRLGESPSVFCNTTDDPTADLLKSITTSNRSAGATESEVTVTGAASRPWSEATTWKEAPLLSPSV